MHVILLGQVFFLLLLLGAWQALATLTDDPTLFPSVSKIGSLVIQYMMDQTFLAELSVTALEIAIAFSIAAPVAVATGFLLGERASRGRSSMSPLLYLVMAIPQSIFLPIFIFAFGIGFLQKIAFGITHAYFVIAVNSYAAARTVSQSMVIAARSFGATRLQTYLHIYIPAMLPLVLTGLRLGINFCTIGVLLAEMYASMYGIGHLIFAWGEAYQVAQLLAAVVIVAGISVIINELLRWAEVHAAVRYGTFQR